MGGDRNVTSIGLTVILLKSAPPVWAGTVIRALPVYLGLLKSAPPVWAGTGRRDQYQQLVSLKSAPPVWAGTQVDHDVVLRSLT